MGESSKIVPTLIENCFLGCLTLHSHFCRVGMKCTSVAPHVGHSTPLGQRIAIRQFNALSPEPKNFTASCSVSGKPVLSFMRAVYAQMLSASSILLPKLR